MNLKKYAKILSMLLCTSILFIGCTNTNTKSNDSADKLTIVTSFYPMYISTLNIVKDIPDIELVNLTAPQTGCLHDYELSTKDMKILETADILVVNGAGMESFLDKVIAQYPDLDIITASEGIELLEDEDHDEDNHDHDAEEAHNHDTEDDHDHSVNPHVWVSISKNIEQVKNIADKLSSLDSKDSTQITENADEYIAKLEDLSDKMHTELASITNRNIITFHEAFPYFAEEFNLNIVGVLEVEPNSEPSAKELENIIKTVKEYNIKSLFTEPQYSSKAAETVANETGAKIYTLDPIVTGEANENAADDYLNKMNENLKVLKEALK